MTNPDILVLGTFVVDAAFRAPRQPRMGETLIGEKFTMGPGGKGSNQAVAAARLGASVGFISRIGIDAFGTMAKTLWTEEGITPFVQEDPHDATGCAYIFVEAGTGNNAIIIVPGAAMKLNAEDMAGWRDTIAGARVFLTQLETPLEAARAGLGIARRAGTTTLFNPAPAQPLDTDFLSLCDYIIPNESEAEILTGITMIGPHNAAEAAGILQQQGAGTVILTLGEQGAFVYENASEFDHIPALDCGPVVETTGAGDSFCGAFAHALIEGADTMTATRYAVAAASLSVTRPGTAPAMPSAEEVENCFCP
ncbi:MAG: ribokinase [Rhodobacter sp.]|nr:ribokinase [Rhodobacter sp.]